MYVPCSPCGATGKVSTPLKVDDVVASMAASATSEVVSAIKKSRRKQAEAK
jgi:hypothetical protein